MLEKIFLDLAVISLTCGAAVCGVMLISKLTEKRFSAKWRYWIWLIIALRLVIPFNITLPKAPVRIEPPKKEMVFSYSAPEDRRGITENTALLENEKTAELSESIEIVKKVVPAEKKQKVVSFTEALAIAWAGGALISVLLSIGSYLGFKRRTFLWNREPSEEAAGAFESVKKEFGAGNIRLYSNRSIRSPMMLGFIKPAVLIPEMEFTAEEYGYIFRHELTHYIRKDVWYKLLLTLARAAHWFNPFVALMCRTAENDIEISCDEKVSAKFRDEERQEYCEVILDSIRRGGNRKVFLSTGFYGGKSVLKKRFGNILSPKLRKGWALAILALIIVAGCGVLVACEQNNEKMPEEDPAKEDIIEENSALEEQNEPDNAIDMSGYPKVSGPDEDGYYTSMTADEYMRFVRDDYQEKPDKNDIPVPEEPITPALEIKQFRDFLTRQYPEVDDWELVHEENRYVLKFRYDPFEFRYAWGYAPQRLVILKTEQSNEFDRVIFMIAEYMEIRTDMNEKNETIYTPYKQFRIKPCLYYEEEIGLDDFSEIEWYGLDNSSFGGLYVPKEKKEIVLSQYGAPTVVENFDYHREDGLFDFSWLSSAHRDISGRNIKFDESIRNNALMFFFYDIDNRDYFYYNGETREATPFDYMNERNGDGRVGYVIIGENRLVIFYSGSGMYFYDLLSETPTEHYAKIDFKAKMLDWYTEDKSNLEQFAASYCTGDEYRFVVFDIDGNRLSDFGIGLPVTNEYCADIQSFSYHGGIIYFTYRTEDDEFIHYAVDARAESEHILQKDAW